MTGAAPSGRGRPRVSVLLPVRDGEEHLDHALESLAAQTLRAFEIVVVDDGSRDGTGALLARWHRRDDRVRILRQGREGLVPALERAREAARAPFLARMDADDVAESGRLERQLDLMEEASDLVGCGTLVTYFPSSRVRKGARRYERWINGLVTPEAIERDLFVECPLAHPTFFLRSAAVAAVGGYRDRGWPEDYDLLLRLWEAGGRLGKVPEVLLRWREGEDRLSRTDPRYAPEAFRRCKIHFLRRTLLRNREGVVIWGAGPTGKAFGRELRAVGEELRAWVEVNPRKIGQKIHGAPVIESSSARRYRGALHLAAVGQPGARERIRDAFRELGFEEPREAVAVA